MRGQIPKKVKSVTIVPNLEKTDVQDIAQDIVKWMGVRGVKAIMSEEDAMKLGLPELAADDLAIKDSDVLLCLGGDGTILRAVRLLKGAPVPVIGINLGRVGFLSEVEPHDMYPSMERILAGDFTIDERMMLKCTVHIGDYSYDYLALNEVAIDRNHHQRMLEMDVHINGTLFSKYTADGLILATPTGSTAYSFSVGGPVVSPVTELILLAPINPHSLFGRTMVLNAQDKVVIELPKKLEVTIGIDGFAVIGSLVDSVSIEKAETKVLLGKLRERSFYNLFKDKIRIWDTWLR